MKGLNGTASFSSQVKLLAEEAVRHLYSRCRSTNEYCVGDASSGFSQIDKLESDRVNVEINYTCHYGRKPDTIAVIVEGSDEKIVSDVMNNIMMCQYAVDYGCPSIQEALERGLLTMAKSA
ncbi:MAG: hypothetical protein Q8Q06_01600 [bacterium]|nr:hypothetical protein [bacterium]